MSANTVGCMHAGMTLGWIAFVERHFRKKSLCTKYHIVQQHKRKLQTKYLSLSNRVKKPMCAGAMKSYVK